MALTEAELREIQYAAHSSPASETTSALPSDSAGTLPEAPVGVGRPGAAAQATFAGDTPASNCPESPWTYDSRELPPHQIQYGDATPPEAHPGEPFLYPGERTQSAIQLDGSSNAIPAPNDPSTAVDSMYTGFSLPALGPSVAMMSGEGQYFEPPLASTSYLPPPPSAMSPPAPAFPPSQVPSLHIGRVQNRDERRESPPSSTPSSSRQTLIYR